MGKKHQKVHFTSFPAHTYAFVGFITVELERTRWENTDTVHTIAFEVATNTFFTTDLLKRLYDTGINWRLALGLENDFQTLKGCYHRTWHGSSHATGQQSFSGNFPPFSRVSNWERYSHSMCTMTDPIFHRYRSGNETLHVPVGQSTCFSFFCQSCHDFTLG